MSGTALVLGGGGTTGLAWEVGVLTGLAHAGIDLGSADAVIGTSAGALLGAQLRSGSRPATVPRRALSTRWRRAPRYPVSGRPQP